MKDDFGHCFFPVVLCTTGLVLLSFICSSAYFCILYCLILCQKVLNLLLMFLKEIDDYIVQAKERSYETMVNFGKQGLSIAATAAVSAAVKASVCVCVELF